MRSQNPDPKGGSADRLVARQIAYTVLFIMLLGSGSSLALLMSGNRTLAWQLCAGFGVFILVVFLIGGLLVGRARS